MMTPEASTRNASANHRALKRSKGGKGGSKGVEIEVAASGAQEVPAEVITETTGHLEIEFDAGFTGMYYDLSVFHGMLITQAHLHCAPAGFNGDVIAFLYENGSGVGTDGIDVDGRLSKGTLTNDDIIDVGCGSNIASLYAAMLSGSVYLNVHSEANPPGEVRAQIFA